MSVPPRQSVDVTTPDDAHPDEPQPRDIALEHATPDQVAELEAASEDDA